MKTCTKCKIEKDIEEASQQLINQKKLRMRITQLEDQNLELREKLSVLEAGPFEFFTIREPTIIQSEIELTPLTLYRMRLAEPYHLHLLMQHDLPGDGFQMSHMIDKNAYKQCLNKEAFLNEMTRMFVSKIFEGI